mgnify:CR=1 FL=1
MRRSRSGSPPPCPRESWSTSAGRWSGSWNVTKSGAYSGYSAQNVERMSSGPIWYDAIGQCFMRAGHTVGPGPERSKGYFLLLRRLLDMGMDPNPKFHGSSFSKTRSISRTIPEPICVTGTFCTEYPEYTPDFVTFHRREVLDGDGEPFR